ncbi:hypothetical protein MES5069_360123 [Mesorhizobium escarrei]|uniref:Uncharacterized protein n=1 Tax=Mesorhizobium escarrei TaxID=666018 RepID=A0ABN8JYD2_9HYPH|nr:hypothetical protein MES5069_360123 [Mesorhizobium escarrei]
MLAQGDPHRRRTTNPGGTSAAAYKIGPLSLIDIVVTDDNAKSRTLLGKTEAAGLIRLVVTLHSDGHSGWCAEC